MSPAVLLLLLISSRSPGPMPQDPSDRTVTLSLKDTPLSEALKAIFVQANADYLIAQDITPDPRVTLMVKDASVGTALTEALRQAGQADLTTVETRDAVWIVRPVYRRTGSHSLEPFKLSARFREKDLRYAIRSVMLGVRRNWSVDVSVQGTVTAAFDAIEFDRAMSKLLRQSRTYAWYFVEDEVVCISCDPTRDRKKMTLTAKDTRISSILRSLCDQDRISYVIAWPIVGEPKVTFSTSNSMLEDAIDKLSDQISGDLGPASARYRNLVVLTPRRQPVNGDVNGLHVSMLFRQIDVREALHRLSEAVGCKCEIDSGVTGKTDTTIRDRDVHEALDIFCDIAEPRLAWKLTGDVMKFSLAHSSR